MISKTKRCRDLGFDQGGFSLIEAMVAIAIFAIGVLGAYKMQLHSTEGNALANRVSTSAMWASYAIEEILGKPYDHEDLRDDGGGVDGSNEADGEDGLKAGLPDVTLEPDGQLHIETDGSTTENASGNELYSIYWNIVQGGDPDNLIRDAGTRGPPDYLYEEDSVLNDVKQIRVHVIRNGGIGNGHLYSHDYYKAKWPESDN